MTAWQPIDFGDLPEQLRRRIWPALSELLHAVMMPLPAPRPSPAPGRTMS
jgi:hypothetical protein